MSEGAAHKFMKFVDPNPVFHQDIICRVQKQLELKPIFEKLDVGMSKIAAHLQGITSAMEILTGVFGALPVDPKILQLFSSFSSLFMICGNSIATQCSMNINTFKTILLPALERFKNEFTSANNDVQRAMEEYGQLNKKSRPEQVKQAQTQLESSMCNRAGALWNLNNCLRSAESTTFAGISISLNSCMKVIATEFGRFLNDHKTDVDFLLELNQAPKQELLKTAFKKWGSTDICSNEGYNRAKEFWDIRTGRTKATDENSEASGVIWIRGHYIITTWTRKFAIFNNGELVIYHPETGVKEQTLPLSLVTVAPVQKKKRNHCFKVQSPQDAFQFQAISEFDRELWFETLNKHNMTILTNGETSEIPKNAEVSEQICADCGGNDATWCSLNWCTSLCLKCSGVHRQMSSTTSKVRSIQLDKLHPYIQDMLSVMTNSAANNLLMSKPCNVEVIPRMEEPPRRDFITRKYQAREWATSDPVPNPFDAIKNLDHLSLIHAMNFGKADEKYASLTPVHAAVESGDPLMVAIASCCVNDLDITDCNGWTPLTYALVYDHRNIAKFLLQMGANPAKASVDMVALACKTGDPDIIGQVLALAKYDPSASHTYKPACTEFVSSVNSAISEVVIPEKILLMAKQCM